MNIINEFFVSFILIKLYFKFKVCRKIKFPLLWKFYFSKWKFYFSADTFIDEKEIKIYKSEIYKDKIFNAPIGKIVKKEKNFFIVSTKDGTLKITKFKGEVKIGYNFKIYTKNERGG